MRIKEKEFPSGELLLEGIIGLPDGEPPFPAVVVCHPHPLYGGSMHNNVVNALCKALVRTSIVALKFNFRGVGGSRGKYGGGIGEQEDVAAAVSFIGGLAEVDSGRIGVAGYSAGAGYSVSAAVADERIRAFAAVSPPLDMFDFKPLVSCRKPKLLVIGDRDDYTPLDSFRRFCRDLPEPKECHSFEGVGHFWERSEQPMAEQAADFFSKALAG